MSYLGIDLGTSGLRALLLAEDGSVLGSAEHSCSSEHKHPGWSEQDPADWVAALEGRLPRYATPILNLPICEPSAWRATCMAQRFWIPQVT